MTGPQPEREAFEPIPDGWRQHYLKRSVEKLPGDLVAACDQLRAQKKEIDTLRGDLLASDKKNGRLKIQKAVLMAILGGAAAEGIEVAILALLKLFTR